MGSLSSAKLYVCGLVQQRKGWECARGASVGKSYCVGVVWTLKGTLNMYSLLEWFDELNCCYFSAGESDHYLSSDASLPLPRRMRIVHSNN